MRSRTLVATLVLAALVTGSWVLAAPVPPPGDLLSAAGDGKDRSCFDPNPGRGKSKGTLCDPPFCGPCEELLCGPGKCKFECVPIPGCAR